MTNQTKPDSAAPGRDAQLPQMEAPMPTVADAEAAIDGALSDALKAVKVLYTMLRKVNLQGFAVADEVAASIVYAQKMRAALSAPKQVGASLDMEIMEELERAVTKFPTWPTDPIHAVAVLNEEVGELNKALLQSVYEPNKVADGDVRSEAVQVAAMAVRFLRSLPAYRYAKSEQHQQTITGEA